MAVDSQLISELFNTADLGSPEGRIEWLASLEYSEFKSGILGISSAARGLDLSDFDGHIGASNLASPNRSEFDQILEKAVLRINQIAEDPSRTIEDKLAACAFTLTAIFLLVHPLEDSNGRTSRVLLCLIIFGNDEQLLSAASAPSASVCKPFLSHSALASVNQIIADEFITEKIDYENRIKVGIYIGLDDITILDAIPPNLRHLSFELYQCLKETIGIALLEVQISRLCPNFPTKEISLGAAISYLSIEDAEKMLTRFELLLQIRLETFLEDFSTKDSSVLANQIAWLNRIHKVKGFPLIKPSEATKVYRTRVATASLGKPNHPPVFRL